MRTEKIVKGECGRTIQVRASGQMSKDLNLYEVSEPQLLRMGKAMHLENLLSNWCYF